MNGVVVGREREIAEASGFLDEAAERSCGLLLVGEPGIGKTTIWQAVIDEAAGRGRDILQARPSEAESELAFAALTDLLARVDDTELGELPDAQRAALEHALRRTAGEATVDPATVALGVLGVLRGLAASSALVVAVDDLQWMDAPSLRALTFAFRRLDGARVGLVATVRAGFELELTRLAERDGNAVERIDLDGLGKAHLAHLVFERTGRSLTPPQLDRLARLSAGNPYYALELAAGGDPELAVPESLAAVLRTRLQSLSGTARATGLSAATLGRFEAGIDAQGLDELRAAGVVAVRSGSVSFAHPLLASTLLDMHTSEERRAAHLALADALDDPDERALHLGHGTETASETVAMELETSAGRVDGRGAPETAAVLAERAAALTPPSDVAGTTRRLLKAADLYQAAGEGRDHVLPLLEHLAGSLPAGPDRARALIRLGWLGAQMDTMPMSESVAYQERALTEAADTADVVTAAHASLARLRGIGGDYRAALRHAELAVEAGSPAEANLMFPSPSGELGIARFFAGEGLDEPLFEAGIARESTAGRAAEPYQSPLLQLGLALLYTGDLTRATGDPAGAARAVGRARPGPLDGRMRAPPHRARGAGGRPRPGRGARGGVPPPRPAAARRPRRGVVPERPRRDACRADRGRTPDPECGCRGGAVVRVDGLAGAPSRGAGAPRARRRRSRRRASGARPRDPDAPRDGPRRVVRASGAPGRDRDAGRPRRARRGDSSPRRARGVRPAARPALGDRDGRAVRGARRVGPGRGRARARRRRARARGARASRLAARTGTHAARTGRDPEASRPPA